MRIGIDCDEVSYQFVEAYRRLLAAERGIDPAELSDPTAWNLDKHWGIDDWRTDFAGRVLDQDLLRVGGVVEGAIKGMNDLVEQGHTLVMVTARDVQGAERKAAADTFAWVAEHELPLSSLILSHDKGCVETDIFFEDGPHNYEMLDTEFETFPVLLARPWNAYVEGRSVTDWAQFVEVVGFVEQVTIDENCCDGYERQCTMREAWDVWVDGQSELDSDDYDFDEPDDFSEIRFNS